MRRGEHGRAGRKLLEIARCERAQLDRDTEQHAKPDVSGGAESPVGRRASPQSADDQRSDIARLWPATVVRRRFEQRAKNFLAPLLPVFSRVGGQQ
jgi:hypothetical protein